MKTLCTWLPQYFSTYNYIMKLCRYKKIAKVKIKFTLFKNVESRNTLETDPACFFPRFSLPFIYTVSDTALSRRPFIKSIFQNVARNQSWKEFSFLLFFTKLQLLMTQNISTKLSYWLYLLSLPPKFIKKCQKTSFMALFYVVFGPASQQSDSAFCLQKCFKLRAYCR